MLKKNLEELLDTCQRSVRNCDLLSQQAAVCVSTSLRAVQSSRALISESDRLLATIQLVPQTSVDVPKASSPAKPVDVLEVIEDRVFRGECLLVDGRHFKACRIIDCTVQYNGQPVIFESTDFEGCRFEFGAEAGLTVQFLECFGIMPPSQEEAVYSTLSTPALRQGRVN